MIRSFDYATSLIIYRFPEPPISPSTGEPAAVATHHIDWEALELPEYRGMLAYVLDNVFSAEDCQRLLAAGETSAPWTPAAVNAGPEDTEGAVVPDFRKSSRILLDDKALADWILDKLRRHIPGGLDNAPSSRFSRQLEEGGKEAVSASRVELTRLNERLRYLKYIPGDFFDDHCDAVYYTPDRSEISCLTLQIYLNGSSETLKGGATRFKGFDTRNVVVDVEPRVGRVLLFEQETLLHTGERLLEGEKYVVRTDFMYKVI
ncbi:hypothetical protein FS837_000540 [Tulasnella sp. UAMH 9824]|nr:hypothetical protein FS837_000540 [Tulasnella sp. UAMH 9824]